jgi:hypothetical protein
LGAVNSAVFLLLFQLLELAPIDQHHVVRKDAVELGTYVGVEACVVFNRLVILVNGE